MAKKHPRPAEVRRKRRQPAARVLRAELLETRSLLSATLGVFPAWPPVLLRLEGPTALVASPVLPVRPTLEMAAARAPAAPVEPLASFASAEAAAPLTTSIAPEIPPAAEIASRSAERTTHASLGAPATAEIVPVALAHADLRSAAVIALPQESQDRASSGVDTAPAGESSNAWAPVIAEKMAAEELSATVVGSDSTAPAPTETTVANHRVEIQRGLLQALLIAGGDSAVETLPPVADATAHAAPAVDPRTLEFTRPPLSFGRPAAMAAADRADPPLLAALPPVALPESARASGSPLGDEARNMALVSPGVANFDARSEPSAVPRVPSAATSGLTPEHYAAGSRSAPPGTPSAVEGGYIELQATATPEAAQQVFDVRLAADQSSAARVEAAEIPLADDPQTAQSLAQDDTAQPAAALPAPDAQAGSPSSAPVADRGEGGLIELAAAPVAAHPQALGAGPAAPVMALVSAEYGNSLAFAHEVCMDRALGLYHAFELAGDPLPADHSLPRAVHPGRLAAAPVHAAPNTPAQPAGGDNTVVRAGLFPVAGIALAVAAFDRLHRENGQIEDRPVAGSLPLRKKCGK